MHLLSIFSSLPFFLCGCVELVAMVVGIIVIAVVALNIIPMNYSNDYNGRSRKSTFIQFRII